MSPALFQPEETRPHWVWVYFPPSLEPGWREGEGGVWRAGPFLSSPMIIFGLNTQTPLEEGDAPSIGPNCGVPVPPPSCGKEELKRWVYCGYLSTGAGWPSQAGRPLPFMASVTRLLITIFTFWSSPHLASEVAFSSIASFISVESKGVLFQIPLPQRSRTFLRPMCQSSWMVDRIDFPGFRRLPSFPLSSGRLSLSA